MSHIRIVCKAPPSPPHDPASKYPKINGALASITDTSVFLVRNDGTEESIGPLISSIHWTVEGVEPATATLVFLNPELDVEALLQVDPKP